MSWICKRCETENPDSVNVCEVCDSQAPILRNFRYELDLIYNKITFFWESEYSDKVWLEYSDGVSTPTRCDVDDGQHLVLRLCDIKGYRDLSFHLHAANEIATRTCPHSCNISKNIIEGDWKRFIWPVCKNLIRLLIPDTSTTISDLSGCSILQQIVIPDTIKEISNGAFWRCSSLEQIYLPASLEIVGNSIFKECTSLKSIVVSECNLKYDSRENCNAIISTKDNCLMCGCSYTTIPNSIQAIRQGALTGSTMLKRLYIPENVESIGIGAFCSCPSLVSISVSLDNKKFDSREDCNAIINSSNNELICGCQITAIPDSIKCIGESAFEGCSALEQITIPDSVTSIGAKAFKGCSSLKEIVIPNSVTSIGATAFKGCSSLKEIVIPNSVTKIEPFAFSYCSSLKKIVIPNSVTEIGRFAFKGCSSLDEIEIPSSVNKYNSGIFQDCCSLKKVIIHYSGVSLAKDMFKGCQPSLKVVVAKWIREHCLKCGNCSNADFLTNE